MPKLGLDLQYVLWTYVPGNGCRLCYAKIILILFRISTEICQWHRLGVIVLDICSQIVLPLMEV